MSDQPGQEQPGSHSAGAVASALGSESEQAREVREPPFDRLLRRLRGLRSDQDFPAVQTAEALADVERTLWDEALRLDLLNERADGHAVVAEAQAWRRLCRRLELQDSVAAVDRLTDGFLTRAVEAWCVSVSAHLQTPDSDGCFRRLVQNTRLQLTVGNEATGAGVDLGPLASARESLRRGLLECVECSAPSTETRERWVSELTDHCDMVLTAIDHVRPEDACNKIALVIGDLQWHVDHIEPRSGPLRRRLRRRLARLGAEHQERDLQHRLETRFGHRFVAGTERLVLFLICLVVGLMLAEMLGNWSDRAILWFNTIDAAACLVFLCELGTKLCFVRGRWKWFRRHFVIDFIPSIPIGILSHGMTAVSNVDSIRAVRLTRFLRLPRLARYVRLLRPLIRALRGLGLLARGLDRLARRYGHVLNRTVILHPTREELNRGEHTLQVQQRTMRRLRSELRERWRQLMTQASESQRPGLAQVRLNVLTEALERTPVDRALPAVTELAAAEEIPLDQLIEDLRTMTPEDAEATLGHELTGHLARAVRVLVRAPFRWMPLIGRWLPPVTEETTDAEVVAATSGRVARVLKRYHSIWFWVADLYGTVTPSQFVDRVGTMLVNSSARPAYRLLLFGGLYILLVLVLELVRLQTLEPVLKFLEQYVGPTVMLVGGVCILILTLGWWLKRLAREATEFLERSAQAQFLSLTETFRSRNLQRDTEILYDRVLRPEWLLVPEPVEKRSSSQTPTDAPAVSPAASAQSREEQIECFRQRVRESLLDTFASGGEVFEGMESTILLYRDWLDGAMFTDNDTRTTGQLLGNPAVRQFLNQSGRVTKSQKKSLRVLDLVHQKSLLGGPYLWFNFISRSATHGVASLLVDYNQQAVPLAEQPQLNAVAQDRYRNWLATEEAAFEDVSQCEREGQDAALSYVTNAFTALHFLDFAPERDREVEQRFGPRVLAKLRHDRSLMIRRIFGSLPMHQRPHEQRVVNLYSLYSSWLADGRAFLVPWYLFVLLLRSLKQLLQWIAASVQEIRRPELRTQRRDAANAHFRSAVRKIGRIRDPVVVASLRLRMSLDPEYLGVPLPDRERSLLEGTDVDSDLRFLQPPAEIVEELERARQQAASDMDRLRALISDGLLDRVADRLGLPAEQLKTPSYIRAAAVAYLADLRAVRRHLSAQDILEEVFRSAAAKRLLPGGQKPRPLLRRRFNRYWAKHGFGGKPEQLAAWRAAARNVRGVADALSVWHRFGENAQEEGERLLSEVLQHAGRVTEQLVALRTIQTLAVLDVLSYREHVYRLGQYADMGDEAGELLYWKTTTCDF